MTESKTIHGHGVFVYPSIQVYDGTGPLTLGPLSEWKKRPIIINKEFEKDFRILITDDGGVCPITDKTNSIDFLNVFFATMTLLDYPAYHMKLRDFTGFTWKEGEDKVQMNLGIISQSIRSQLEVKRDEKSTLPEWQMYPRERIEKNVVLDFLKLAYEFYSFDELKEDVILIGEAFSMFHDQMFTASYLYSWMIIENFLERLWLDYVDSKYAFLSEENTIMKKFVRQTPDSFIKIFTELDKIDTKGCQTLHKLRQIRNDIVHDKYTPSQDESFECISSARLILMNRIEGKNPFDSLELKKENDGI